MSEYMFGATKTRVSQAVAKKLDKICKEEGGYGFTGPVSLPGNETKGWFTAPNRGCPFDDRLAARVLARVEAAGIKFR